MKEIRIRSTKLSQKKIEIPSEESIPIKKRTRILGLKGNSSKKIIRRRKENLYPSSRCDHINEDGIQCLRPAAGSSIYCNSHGGIKNADDLNINRAMLKSDAEALAIGKTAHTLIFDPAIHPLQYIQQAALGKSPAEIAAIFKISKHTLNTWAETYESFYDAYHIGATMYEAFWIEKGVNNLETTRFNTSLYKFLTGNLLGFSEKTESRIHQTSITGVLVIPAKAKSDEAWELEAMSGLPAIDI